MYLGARYYDPTIGRFITRDPVKGNNMNPQTLNPYVYCLNNPLKYIDPDGESPWDHELLPDGDVVPDDDRLKEYMEEIRSGEHNFDEETERRIRGWSLEAYYEGTEFLSDYNLKTRSIGIEASGSLGAIAGQKYSVGQVRNIDGGDPHNYISYGLGGGLGASGSVSVFISSLEPSEYANQDQNIDFDLQVDAWIFSIEYQKNKNGNFTFSTGLGGGLGGVFYWIHKIFDEW